MVDLEWLAAPERRYPVRLDPAINLPEGGASTVVMRPDSVIANGTWSPAGPAGTTLASAGSDDSDATWLAASSTSAALVVGLADPSVPAGSTIEAVRSVIRWAAGTGSESLRISHRLGTLTGSPDVFAPQDAYYYRNYSGPLRTTGPGGAPWSAADLAGLAISLEPQDSPNGNWKVFEVWVEVTYRPPAGQSSLATHSVVSSFCPNTCYPPDTVMQVGAFNDGKAFMSFVRYDLSAMAGWSITRAIWHGRITSIPQGVAVGLTLRPLETPWSANTVTWNTRPRPNYYDARYIANPSIGAVTADVTPWVANWAGTGAATSANHGLSLESGTIAGLVKLSSAPADSYLEVTYALAEPELLSPTDAAVTSATPTLVARAIGVPTGTTVSYQFRLSSDSNGNTGALVTSPWSISPSWTVPVGVLADASSYTWRVGVAISPTESRWSSTSRRIRVELRLGIQPTMAYDRHGPFAVNLTNGNLLTTVSGPRFATRAGGLGANLTYSSQGPPIYGLRGRYWRAPCNTASDFTATVPTFVRHDPVVSFSWNDGQLQGPGMAPPPGSAPTRCAAWDGHIRTPGPVTLAVNASDGVRVFIDDNPTPVIDAWSDSVTPRTVTGPLINPGSDGAAIRVEHYDRDGADAISLATMDGGVAVSVPSTWLSPSATNPLPQGWTFDLGGVGLSAQLGSGSVGLGGTEGSTRRHDVAGSPANSWDPTVSYVLKPGDDTALGYAIDNATGDTQMLASGPGGVAIYDHSGRLASVRTAADDGAVVSPIYSWSAEGTLGSVTDPPSGREIALDYGGGDCPSPPAGFDAPSPARMLCRIRYWDGSATDVFYQAGRLALVVNPGGAKTYLGYELVGTNVVMTTLRDGLGSDAADALGGAFATEAGRWLV
ncbi:MAG: DNRLRE domain-containing protein, partial [Acidimicrobiales bacterium]